jgi:MFS family permease
VKLRDLDPRLPREVWILQVGSLLNAFGNGLVLPFLLIYLHNVRGIPLGLAGLAAAVQSAAALLSGFVAGSLADKIGAKRVLVAALLVNTLAFGLMPLIRSPWHAFAIYLLWGAGSGSFWPSQSALLATLTPHRRRAGAYALARLTMNLGVAVGGVAAGAIASVAHPVTFTILFLGNGVTFVAYVLVALRIPSPTLHPDRAAGGWHDVIRDRTMVAFAALNAVFMAAALAPMVELLPAFAKNVSGVSERAVGVVFALESLGIVAFQLPVARLVQGRRRMRGFAAMGLLWAAGLATVWFGGRFAHANVAAAVFAVAMLLVALGESFHGVIHAPLSADLAPPQLVGRYLALASLSWQAGWIIGPAAGGFLLQHAPLTLWPAAAAINVACACCALLLERKLPPRVRTTPFGTAGARVLTEGTTG